MGILISSVIIILWIVNLFYSLNSVIPDYKNPVFYFHLILQAYLYTGLFITAHDSMHGNVASNKKLNEYAGRLCSFLYAGMSYGKLYVNHRNHHSHPGTLQDPDFYVKNNNFFVWWFVFMKRYVTVIQIIYMAVVFNILKYFFGELQVWSFFVIPVVLSTFQLFYFGTYLPHKTPHEQHMLPFKSRTQKKNHLKAMLTCYFFGYHSEHHGNPGIPWWKLYKLK